MDLSLKVEYNRVRFQALSEAPQHVDAAHRRATNRAASRFRTRAVRNIGQRTPLKASYLRERLELSQAKPGRPFATIVGRKRAARLDRFPNRQVMGSGKSGKPVKRGISVTVKRGGGAERIHSAFYVPLRRGGEAGGGGFGIAVRLDVLRRLGKRVNPNSSAQGGSGSRRFEILYGYSIADLLRGAIEGGLDQETLAYYRAQIDAEMRRAIARVRR